LGILVSLLIAYILWRNFLDIILAVGSIIFGFSVYAHEGIWFPAIAFFTSAILAVSAASLFFPSVGNRKL
jgi:hypothetical protein